MSKRIRGWCATSCSMEILAARRRAGTTRHCEIMHNYLAHARRWLPTRRASEALPPRRPIQRTPRSRRHVGVGDNAGCPLALEVSVLDGLPRALLAAHRAGISAARSL